jgi:uncharacterized protein (TIGR03435 family)
LKTSDPKAKSSVVVKTSSDTRIVFSNEPIAELVRLLNLGVADRPVLDKTGLSAAYDFTLEFNRGAPNGEATLSGESVFTAVQAQLGLRLEPAKGPAEVLVIDHVDKSPSPN